MMTNQTPISFVRLIVPTMALSFFCARIAISVTPATAPTTAPSTLPAALIHINSVKANDDDGNVAANAIDGDLATRWSCKGKGAWITADLGSAQTISGASIAWYLGDSRVNHFIIQGSKDGETFTELSKGDSSGKSTNLEKYAFAAVSVRYVKVIVNGNTHSKWNSISELRVEPAAAAPAHDGVVPSEMKRRGIWTSRAELAQLPMSGYAWGRLKAVADGDLGVPKISDQNSRHDTNTLAVALVYGRTGEAAYRAKAAAAILAAIGTEKGGRTLALGRNLLSYVIAADLIDLHSYDAGKDAQFCDWLRAVRSESLHDRTLISTHEQRPNNWGTHAGASRIATDLYLNDKKDLEMAASVFRGWLGDRAAYADFKYGELSWQIDPSKPVGINPVGAIKEGHSLDGVLPDDQRRGGPFSWPPVKENYAWEALQGAVAQAEMLSRAGYDAWNWSDHALLRAAKWQYEVNQFPAVGDDTWIVYLINRAYHTHLAVSEAHTGKNMGFTDWTSGM